MKKIFAVLIVLSFSFSVNVLANEHAAAPEKPVDPKQAAEEIFKKCMSHAKLMRDEQVCKARKPAIEQCMEKETKAKDAKAAKTKCELLHVPDFK